MKITEQTPLVNKRTTRNYYAYALVLTVVLMICGSVYYLSSDQKQAAGSVSYAVRETISRKEVSINLKPEDIYHLEVLNTFSTDDNEWMDYHSEIIEKEGYDPSDESNLYAFTMYDYKYDKEYYYNKYGFNDETFLEADHDGHTHGDDHGDQSHPTSAPHEPTPKPTRPIYGRTPRPTQTPRPTRIPKKSIQHTRPPRPTMFRSPRPTRDAVTSEVLSSGGMTCYFRYSLLESKNTPDHILRCNDDGAIMVGCVGGSTHRAKDLRSGELATDDGCIVNGEAIYIRCCKPDKDHSHHIMTGKMSEVDYEANEEFPTYSLYAYCQATALDGFEDVIHSYHHSDTDHEHKDGSNRRHSLENGNDHDHDDHDHDHDEHDGHDHDDHDHDHDHDDHGDDEHDDHDDHDHDHNEDDHGDDHDEHDGHDDDRTREEDHDGNWVMTGCTAWTGDDEPFESSLGTAHNTMAKNIIGAKIVKNPHSGATNCKAHRGDKGFIAASAIAVSIDGGAELECVTVESGGSRIPEKLSQRSNSLSGKDEPLYGSMVFCPDGYNLMDCTGYNEDSMKDCDHDSTLLDKVSAVVYHGADLKCMTDRGAHCSSSGYTEEIRVQATCCIIKEHHHE